MPSLIRRAPVRSTLVAACIGLAGAHAPAFATTDFPLATRTCPKELGRDPPSAMLKQSCGVWSPGDLAIPSWDVLELTATDEHLLGGGVVATLQCTSRKTGATSPVATVRSERSSTAKTVAVRLPAPLNFNQCAYSIDVAADSTKAAAQALMVTLRN
jgi:hypothetical protein